MPVEYVRTTPSPILPVKLAADWAKRIRQRSGNGLAIIKKIIEDHNGHIWVKSHMGEEATVYFTLG
jgi:signal transduction histidine kinase